MSDTHLMSASESETFSESEPLKPISVSNVSIVRQPISVESESKIKHMRYAQELALQWKPIIKQIISQIKKSASSSNRTQSDHQPSAADSAFLAAQNKDNPNFPKTAPSSNDIHFILVKLVPILVESLTSLLVYVEKESERVELLRQMKAERPSLRSGEHLLRNDIDLS
jgi:hypothetical protein